MSVEHFSTAPAPRTARRWLVAGFSLSLTAVTLYFVFRGIDTQLFTTLLARQDRALLGAACFFVLLQIVFASERWRAVLVASTRACVPPVLTVQALFYASIFFNALPLGTIGGDVARVWLARKFAIPLREVVLSVLVDRVVTVAALLLLAAATLPSIAHPLAATAWLASVVVLGAALAGFLLLQPIEKLLGRWREQRVILFIVRAAEELRYVVRHGGLISLLWALPSAACSSLAAYCIARSLGVAIGPFALMAIMSLVALVVALPISMAGWGVREVSLVALLGLLGIDREAALLVSVEFGLVTTLVSLPGGFVWFVLADRGTAAPPIEITRVFDPLNEGTK